MSIRVMSQVWDLQDLSTHEKLLLLAYADNARDDGRAWPSRRMLMHKTGLSESGVKKVSRRLREKGYLTVEKPGVGNGSGGGFAPVVWVLPQRGTPEAPLNARGVPAGTQRGTPRARRGVPDRTPLPSQEPSQNHNRGLSSCECGKPKERASTKCEECLIKGL